MRRIILLYILVFLSSGTMSFAQNATVRGTVYDTINKQTLVNGSVSLLRQKDSVLYKFARSGEKGMFELNNLKAGKYSILVTYPLYADYTDNFELTDTSKLDLGIVRMILKANLLNDVIVKSKISAIKINGDTTEFKADSFKVREGASVEEMLKKLPGIQVDKDGKITAMGRRSTKSLLMVKSFSATILLLLPGTCRLMLLTRFRYLIKSDQATFTGIDDGQREKTINLKMKEDKKKGYFGKIDLGAGLNDRWNNSAMLNRFRAKMKLSAFWHNEQYR